MSNAIVTVNGGTANLPTILGQGVPKLRTAGKIRAGIKVLTKNAANNSKAKDIYERGVQANRPFEDIEREITQAVPELKLPLVPKNVPYFTVRPDDFPNPALAAHILGAYGEDRGDGVKRLYRFPVVFPADRWQTVMPHELVAWGANDKRYWSEYSTDGRVRQCMSFAPVPRDQTGKRAIRLFGGRKTTARAENGGVCDPERCPEYQNRQCNLSGRFIFFVPGIPSIDAFELHTNSFYAMNAAIQKFQTIAFMRGGRISGFLDDRRTPFYLTKKLSEVTRIDEDGRALRVAQWIIELEAPVDVSALLRNSEDEETTIVNANRAAQVLEGNGGVIEENRSHSAADAHEEQAQPLPGSSGPAQDTLPFGSNPARETTPRPSPNQRINTGASSKQSMPTAEEVFALAEQLGVRAARYEQYATKRWGPGWTLNQNGRRRAIEELRGFELEPAALIDRITHETGVPF